MEYKLKVNITEKDFLAFQIESFFNKRKKIFISICFSLLLLLSFILIPAAIYTGKKVTISLCPLLIFIFAFLCSFFTFPYQCKRFYKSDKTIQEEQTITLKEDGLVHLMERGSYNYTTEDFHHVIFGKKLISIFISKQKAILLPRHCFASKEEEQEIEAFIKEHYVTDKKQK